MEYLMTYGWAVLVVMVVGVSMWQIGIFEAQSTAPRMIGFVHIKPQLAVTSLNSEGVFSSVFTNGVGKNVRITGVRILNRLDDSVICCSHITGMPADCPGGGNIGSDAASDIGGQGAAYFNGGNTVPLAAGENIKVELGGNGGISICELSSVQKGDPYDIRVDLMFQVELGDVVSDRISSGALMGVLD